MPDFFFKGILPDGAEDIGTISSLSEATALRELTERGVSVFEISTENQGEEAVWYRREISFGSSRIKPVKLASTARLLSILLDAGVALPDALNMVSEMSGDRHLARAFRRIRSRILDGSSFAQAVGEDIAFPALFRSLILTGEETNSLALTLSNGASYFSAQHKTKQRVVSMLIYPGILLVASVVLLGILTFGLAPNIAPIFAANSTEMPKVLSLVMSINRSLTLQWPLVLLGFLAILVAGFSAAGFASKAIRRTISLILPFANSAIRDSFYAKSARSLYLLLAAGERLSDALAKTADFFPKDPDASEFRLAHEHLSQGGMAHEHFAQNTQAPVLFTELLRIGETSNRVPEMMLECANTLDDLVAQRLERAMQLFTPVITLVIGIGIGGLVYSLISAILEVNAIAF